MGDEGDQRGGVVHAQPLDGPGIQGREQGEVVLGAQEDGIIAPHGLGVKAGVGEQGVDDAVVGDAAEGAVEQPQGEGQQGEAGGPGGEGVPGVGGGALRGCQKEVLETCDKVSLRVGGMGCCDPPALWHDLI